MSAFSVLEEPPLTAFVSALQLDIQCMGCDLSRVRTIWSISKDLGSNGLRMVGDPRSNLAMRDRADQNQGCCVTQVNKRLATGLYIVSNTQISSLTSIATTSILNSTELPRLFALNSERLSHAYGTVTSMLKRHNIRYVTANMGPFILVRLLPDAQTWRPRSSKRAGSPAW